VEKIKEMRTEGVGGTRFPSFCAVIITAGYTKCYAQKKIRDTGVLNADIPDFFIARIKPGEALSGFYAFYQIVRSNTQ